MNPYCYADVILHTSLRLDELPLPKEGSVPASSIYVRQVTGPQIELPDDSWSEVRNLDTQAVVFAVASCGEGMVLRFPKLADFIVSDDGRSVAIVAKPGCSSETVRHLLLDQAIPRLLANQGRLVLHAGASELGGYAVAFVGESGRGKSTLVASLCDAGHPALSDDALIVKPEPGGVTCLQLYPALRLWPDSVAGLALDTNRDQATQGTNGNSSKRRLPISKCTAGAPIKLSALFILEEEPCGGSAPRITATPLSRREACVALLRASFQLDIGNPASAARTLEQAAHVAKRLPIFGLSYPREYPLLPEVHEVILEQLQQPKVQVPGVPPGPGLP